MRAILFNVVHLHNDSEDVRKVLNIGEQRIPEQFARELVSGSTKFSKLTCIKKTKNDMAEHRRGNPPRDHESKKSKRKPKLSPEDECR